MMLAVFNSPPDSCGTWVSAPMVKPENSLRVMKLTTPAMASVP